MREPFNFDPHIDPGQIILVGLGGTGSQWARGIARIIYDMQRRRIRTPKVIFVDPDKVEEKNVGRQMFAHSDVGQYKAELLAKRFNKALGLDIAWVNDIFKLRQYPDYGSAIVCAAVDNHDARASIAKAKDGMIWIDAGNHASNGQVIIGNSDDPKRVASALDRPQLGSVRWLPSAALVFPELLEPPAPTPIPDLSCAELMEEGFQHLLINEWMAMVGSQYVYKLLHREPIKSFMTFVSVEAMQVRPIPITHADLAVYVPALRRENANA